MKDEMAEKLLVEMKAINVKFDRMLVLLKHLTDKMG